MREILFRGKRLDNGKWVYGNYCKAEYLNGGGYEHFIVEIEAEGKQYLVDPETVGQWINKGDITDRKVYEGDIVKLRYGWSGDKLFLVKLNEKLGFPVLAFLPLDGYFMDTHAITSIGEAKIVGNIYDNPELLKEVQL